MRCATTSAGSAPARLSSAWPQPRCVKCPDLHWYVGLSGVLHGLFIAGALRWMSRAEIEGYVLAAFLVVKLVWEQVYGALPMSVSGAGGPVVVDAHTAGAVGGLACAFAVLLHDWHRVRR